MQENERFDILIEVSLDNLSRLFLSLDDPVTLRQSVAEVIFHVLASLRESTEAFDRVIFFLFPRMKIILHFSVFLRFY